MQANISIIIPCYNAAKYIEQTFQSIFSQSYQASEIIVVDDGSTDNSKALILKQTDTRINYVFQKNKGVSSARNKGLDMATGNYILFLDADDLLEPDFLKARVKALENNPENLFTCSLAILIDEKNNSFEKHYAPVCIHIEEEICTYKSGYCSCPSNYLIKSEFKQSGIRFHESLSNSADRFFLLQLNKIGKGTLVAGNCKLKYRIHSDSMSKNINSKNISDLILFYRLVLNHKLVPKMYYWRLKLKTFRISFSEALLIKKPRLLFKAIGSVLLKA